MRRLSIVIATVLVAFVAVVGAAGEVLSRPASSLIGAAPPDLRAQSITLRTLSNESVSGWFARGTPGRGAVLLLHGVHADRRQMLNRARFLSADGYSVLLIDLPAHGESSGSRITFGFREGEGVKTALNYLAHEIPGEKIAVIGVSLGAASFVLSNAQPAPSAVVLESMYPTISEAVGNRLETYLGSAGKYLAPLLLWQLPLRLDVSAEQLRPIKAIPSLRAPVLILSGTEDKRTTLSETKRIFEVANEPKELWVIQGAAHVDLHAFAPKMYETIISKFLAKHIRNVG